MFRSLLMLGLATAAFAVESSYTGPMFNPSEAPYFAQTGLVIPTESNLPAIQPTDAFSAATTISGIILPSTLSQSSSATPSHSSSHSVSSQASSSASRTASSAVSSVASSSAPAQQSTAAAAANRIGVAGAVAGGLLAGLALA
ncbi:hypothetical protein OPT61_g7815 [Boeremia exigua]|uniref:Uncharacterized protein n=1 Tax=Boeremia exigua TaxID=749465 RepID=A0ACC2I1S3_9PLEO|nr:hypothetical protein OPT61_g7815 [Boeremia exigua]